jgi:hypothetical protein
MRAAAAEHHYQQTLMSVCNILLDLHLRSMEMGGMTGGGRGGFLIPARILAARNPDAVGRVESRTEAFFSCD